MLLKDFLRRHSLVVGIALMFALTWPFYSALGLFVGYGLALASLIMTGLTLGRAGVVALLRRYLIWWVGIQWYLVVLLGPAILILTGTGLNLVLGGAAPDFKNVEARHVFGTSTNLWIYVIPFFLVDLLTNGEEIAWRGYVLPRLQTRFSALVSSLIVGGVWGLWHMPKFWGDGDGMSFALVMAHNIAAAVLFAWVYNNTKGSLLLATLFHAALNTSYVFLQIAPAEPGDITLEMTIIGVELLAAAVVAVVASPERLRRQPPAQAQAQP
jgi:membrane protease YdiL (CAAX protease family)